MKVKNLTKFCIMLLIILMGLLLGNTKVFAVRDRNNVILLQDESDKSVVHVYLGMKEDASIASFQIGLKLNTTADATFTPDGKLNNDNFKVRYNKESGALNLYYAGSSELNVVGSDEKVEIGKINFNADKNHDVTVQIVPEGEFTTASSIGHAETIMDVKVEDKLDFVIQKTSSSGGSSGGTTDPGGENPGGSQGENQGGTTPGGSQGGNSGGSSNGETPTPGNPNSPNNPGANSGNGNSNGNGTASGDGNTGTNQNVTNNNQSSNNNSSEKNKNQNSNEYKGILPKTGDMGIGGILIGLALAFVIVPTVIVIYRKKKQSKYKF